MPAQPQRGLRLLLCAAYVLPSLSLAPPAARLTLPAAELPARWRKVHDCERPSRWRQSLDDEDCAALLASDGAEPPVAANARAYRSLVPSLDSVRAFLEANDRAAAAGKLLVVKFYSERCPACLRIAAKYRRLATDFGGAVDCYEAELKAARPLLEALGVTAVPSLQIFDGEGVTRLFHGPCHPKDFKKVASKVKAAARIARERRGLLRCFGERMGEELRAAPDV